MKKKLDGMGGGVDVESEAGGEEHDYRQPEDSDDVIGPPLPPGYNVHVHCIYYVDWRKIFICAHDLLLFCRCLRLVLVVVAWSTTVRGRDQGRSQRRRRRKVM